MHTNTMQYNCAIHKIITGFIENISSCCTVGVWLGDETPVSSCLMSGSLPLSICTPLSLALCPHLGFPVAISPCAIWLPPSNPSSPVPAPSLLLEPQQTQSCQAFARAFPFAWTLLPHDFLLPHPGSPCTILFKIANHSHIPYFSSYL